MFQQNETTQQQQLSLISFGDMFERKNNINTMLRRVIDVRSALTLSSAHMPMISS